LSAVHERSGRALLKLCLKNGGVYIKLGQTVCTLDYLAPEEYVRALQPTLDRAPTMPISDVRQVVTEELGRPPEDIWDDFDPTPIASASLAQVHTARDRATGAKLAIKVQHRGLRETAAGDIHAVQLIVDAIAVASPHLRFEWLAEELARNLPKELDFSAEGRNAERCAAALATGCGGCSGGGDADVVVPRVYWETTTPRVLTMAFEEGKRATDAAALRAVGIKLPRVAALVSRTFCDQIFRHGFVHCDPHGANLLVRPHPRGGSSGGSGGRPQLVLLDHGLYRELDQEFRLDYCRLWKALVTADLAGVEHYCRKMHAGDMYALLAAMLTSRPFDEIAGGGGGGCVTGSGGGAAAEARMVQGYVNQYMREISDMLARVPREMILLFKTNDCLRHIDRSLGAPINTLVIAARTVADVLLAEAWADYRAGAKDTTSARVRRWLARFWQLVGLLAETLRMRCYIAALQVQEWRLERRAE
ncbi:unnamed protein product, partial [Phaeothamnion confervicola]